jgi:hypothetical protein
VIGLIKLKNVEMGRDCWIKSQTSRYAAGWHLGLRGQVDPALGGRIAHDVMEFKHIVGRERRRGWCHEAEAEEEAIAGVQLVDVQVPVVWQKREGRVDRRGCADGDVGEVEVVELGAKAGAGIVEEADEGVLQLLAVGGVRDEVAPGRGDALEAVDGLGGKAG